MLSPPNSLKQIFDSDTIEYLKNNKDQIIPELLEKMRSFGNEGKRLAIEILDTERDHEGYYLDSFGNRLSFNGNRGLKGAFAKLDLAEIHETELLKCAQDINYFKDNYVRIRTKDGINFPEMRDYQNDFIDVIVEDDNEDIIGLLPRQCCTAETIITVDNKDITMEGLFNECKRDKRKNT